MPTEHRNEVCMMIWEQLIASELSKQLIGFSNVTIYQLSR